MTKDQAKGRVREAGGKLQKTIGKAVASPAQEGKGMAREQAGKAQKSWGGMKEEVRQTREDTKPRSSRKPT